MAELLAAYRAGATSIELTELYGISKPAVLDLLHEHGPAKRKPGLAPEQVKRKP